MDIDVIRYNSQSDFTDGLLFIDGEFQVHTLEDENRTLKVFGKTCIPRGRYKIELRLEGGFHNRYLKKYGPDFHRGMLWIKDVPDFEYILIHTGNDDEDTAGCLLVGMSNNADDKGFISFSGQAYKKIYPKISKALLKGEEVWINYKNVSHFN